MTALSVTHAPASADTQEGWAICRKCKGVFFSFRPSRGVCPYGGEHDARGFPSLEILRRPSSSSSLRWCRNCEGLFSWFPGAPQQGACPAFPGGAGHDPAGSAIYELVRVDIYDSARYAGG